jgi:hypothetical protein
LKFAQLALELGAEVGAFERVDGTAKALGFVIECSHSGSTSAKVGVVVNSVEQVAAAVAFGSDTKKSSHKS